MSQRPRRETRLPSYLKDYNIEKEEPKSEKRKKKETEKEKKEAEKTKSDVPIKVPKAKTVALLQSPPPALPATENNTFILPPSPPLPPSTTTPTVHKGTETNLPVLQENQSEQSTPDEGIIDTYPPEEPAKTFTDSEGQIYNVQQLKDLVKKLYVSKDWPAAFSGIDTMKRELYLLRKISAPSWLISEALNENPVYVMSVLSKKNLHTQHYDVNSFGEIKKAVSIFSFTIFTTLSCR